MPRSRNRPPNQGNDSAAANRPSPRSVSNSDPATLIARISAEWAGPLPPPNILRGYEEIVPGAAERIINLLEKQSTHRMGLEDFTVKADASRANRGLFAGVAVTLSFGVGAVYLIASGHDIAGTFLGTIDLASLVGTFIYGTKSRREERESRSEIMAAAASEQRHRRFRNQ